MTSYRPHRKRLSGFFRFLRSQLPSAPARVLEIGCGPGDLARALAGAGHDVTAIDPEAPDGPIFRRVRLEEFSSERRFDVVVASVALHHVDDLAAALEKVTQLLRPAGLLVLEEFAKERLEGATARWYYHQRHALAAVGREDAALSGDFDAWKREWENEHAGIHAAGAMRRELDHRFAERLFSWVPYLYDYRLDDALEPLERKLIASGEVQATGFRYVGQRTAELDGDELPSIRP